MPDVLRAADIPDFTERLQAPLSGTGSGVSAGAAGIYIGNLSSPILSRFGYNGQLLSQRNVPGVVSDVALDAAHATVYFSIGGGAGGVWRVDAALAHAPVQISSFGASLALAYAAGLDRLYLAPRGQGGASGVYFVDHPATSSPVSPNLSLVRHLRWQTSPSMEAARSTFPSTTTCSVYFGWLLRL